jgi:capsular exopolysaccharide synthesis family protein
MPPASRSTNGAHPAVTIKGVTPANGLDGATRPAGDERVPGPDECLSGAATTGGPTPLSGAATVGGPTPPVQADHNTRRMSHSSAAGGRQGRSSSDDQSLLRYWLVLRERVWVIVACTLLVLAATIVYVEVAPRTYQAEAEMEVQATSPNATILAALPILHQTGDPTEDVLTGASLVTTQPVADAVISSLKLKMSPTTVLADVQSAPIGQAGLVAVQASASSPALAQRLANAFVQQTIALSTARMHAAIQSELPTLQSQLTSVPIAQRYGPGSLGEQVDELEQLVHQNDPTLVNAASAALPTAPSSPKTKLSLVAGLVAGLLVGIGAAFLFHALDPRIRREEQLRDRFGLPVLARIPNEPRSNRRARPLLPSELSRGGHEGYRTLRTILAARARSSESRIILITGSAPAEGKSTTAMGLAAALAHGGARVILIEADFRKPTFASSFNLAKFTGTEQVLLGKVELSKALVPVRVDGAPVRVLAAHAFEGENASQSFAVVRKLLDDAKALADFVVVDSAPLTAVIDALPFAQAADDVVVVARLDQTRLNKLEELDDLLGEHGIPRTGVVLIGEHPMRRMDYYYAEGNGTSGTDLPKRPAVRTEASRKAPLQE